MRALTSLAALILAGSALAQGFGRFGYTQKISVPGLQLGYEHSFVHAMVEFVRGLESGKGCTPNFEDGLATDYVVDAVLKSAKSRKWENVKKT